MSKKEESQKTMEFADLALLLTVLSEKIHNISYYESLQEEHDGELSHRLHKIILIHTNTMTVEQQMAMCKHYPNLQPHLPDGVLALTKEKRKGKLANFPPLEETSKTP